MDDTELMIKDCLKRKTKLSHDENKFIHSISNQYNTHGSLTDKQLELLDQIWDRVTS